ncbi:hypothetical protein UlMin_001921 [Ulmus minor]
MVAQDSPDRLPAGWTVQFKVLKSGRKVETYTNSEVGKCFFSKDDVIHYTKVGNAVSDNPQSLNGPSKGQPERNPLQIVKEKVEHPEWLPRDWRVEQKFRKSGVHAGKDYKCYIDPLNKYKFYSRPEVLQHLKTVGSKSCISENVKTVKNKSLESEKKTSQRSADKVVVESPEVKDLPSGWTKEIRIRKCSNEIIKKDPYYTDPVSGYIFRSKKDALRYVETGEIGRLAIKPKNSCAIVQDLVNNGSTSSSAAKRQKLKHPASRQQIFAGKTNSEKSGLELSETEGSKISRKRVFPEAKVASASKDETVQGKHSLGNAVQGCTETKENSASNKSTQLKPEGSKQTRNKSSPVSNAVVSRKSQRINGPVLSPEIQKCAERKESSAPSRSPQLNAEGSESSRDKRSAVSDAELSKESQGKRNVVDNGQVISTASDILQEKSSLPTLMEKSSVGETSVKSRKSKNKTLFTSPRRSSKRLAGVEPDELVKLKSGEQTSIAAVRNSSKAEAKEDAGLISDGLADGALGPSGVGPEIELTCHASVDTSMTLQEDPSNKSAVPFEDQVAPVELQQKLKTEKVDDDKAEPQLSFLFGSDPCLEFAFKTLTGELPLDDTAIVDDIATHSAVSQLHENSLESGMKKSREKARVNTNRSKKKEFTLPRRSSKRLSGVEPELVANSVVIERDCQNSTRKPSENGATSATDLAVEANQPVNTGQETDLPILFSTNPEISMVEPSSENGRSSEIPAVLEEQPQMLEIQNADLENPEPQLSFSFGDYWSDPCLDFAYKTLTGEIPIEDSLLQGYFQEPLDPAQSKKNGGLDLPDFGSSSLFQTDISSQFESPEKYVPGQQLSTDSTFRPPGNTNVASCSGVSQQHCLEGSKDLDLNTKKDNHILNT